jgi:structural hemagglutinin/hemolysin toxin protein RtxA
MYQLAVYIPASHLELVKQAMFAAGGGRIGNYDSCAWQVAGLGQFRPLAGANPQVGVVDSLARVEEFRVELVVLEEHIHDVVAAMKFAHPYEEPAYAVIRLESF